MLPPTIPSSNYSFEYCNPLQRRILSTPNILLPIFLHCMHYSNSDSALEALALRDVPGRGAVQDLRFRGGDFGGSAGGDPRTAMQRYLVISLLKVALSPSEGCPCDGPEA